MSSDLCKKATKKTTTGTGGGGTTTPPKTDPPKDPNAIAGQTLRSKHLKIVSEDLYYSGNRADRITDKIRARLFNHFGPSLEKYILNVKDDSQWTMNFTDKNIGTFDISPNNEAFANQLYKDSESKGKVFEYINFTLNVPFDQDEISSNKTQSGRKNQEDPGFVGADPRISTYKFQPTYNFYSKEYEDKVSNPAVDERAIPNAQMYNFLLESLYDHDTKNYDKQYLDFLSYSDKPSVLKTLLEKTKPNFNGYLEKYVVPATNLKSDSVSAKQRKKFNNLVVTQDDAVEYNQFTEKNRGTTFYGFYLESPFETPGDKVQGTKDDFKKIFKETNTDLNLYSAIITSRGGSKTNQGYYVNNSYIEATKNTPVLDFSTVPKKFETWDMTDFFTDYKKAFSTFGDSSLNLNNNESTTILGETNDAIQKYSENSTYDFFRKLMNKVADVQFDKTVEHKKIKNLRSLFKELPATPYEVLFYRIEKKNSDGVTLQNFYIPNPLEEDQFKNKLIKFFDSQVKYDELYSYEVFAYPLVVGKKYYYEPVYDRTRFTLDKSYKYYVVFNFLDYVLFNSARLKSAVVTSNTKLIATLNTLVNEFIKLFSIGVKGTMYKKFVADMKKELKAFVADLEGLINDFPEEKTFSTEMRIYLYYHSRIPDMWFFSAMNFLASYTKDVKRLIRADLAKSKNIDTTAVSLTDIDAKLADLADSWSELANFFIKLVFDKVLFVPTDIKNMRKDFLELSKHMSAIYYEKFGVTAGSSGAKVTDFDAFRIVMQDYIPLMEIPLYTVQGRILDSPPVSPSISFVPLKDTDNRILIKLQSQNTEYYAKPKAILNKDKIEIQKMIKSRGTDEYGRLLYRTDDYLSRFEVYRMDERPKSYEDFAPHLRKRIDLKGKYSSYTLNDKIEANKKYYYTFRSFDVHGHYSNPTPVYEFILNNDGGFLFPEIRIVDFEVSDYFEFSKTMQKYIQIKPSAQNVILDPALIKDKQSARDLDCETKASVPPPLGVASNAVWGKNFKLRITSKTSGKKIDVNFNFGHKEG